MFTRTKLFAAVLVVAVTSLVPISVTAQQQKITVAWSVWTGWMPFKLMDKEGFLVKRLQEQGLSADAVVLSEYKGYTDSVTAFAAKQVDGCSMTCMETLQPASSGVKTVAVVANDTSNGGDGVISRLRDMKALKGKTIYLEQFSVSHYILTRALTLNGMTEADVKIANMPGDDAGKSFLTDTSIEAVATWNPHLFNAEESGKGNVIFNSKQIPGEIIDLIVLREDVVKNNPKAVQALVNAWYDAVGMLNASPEKKERAISIMADGAGSTPAEFTRMLAGTDLYTSPEQTVSFFKGPKIQSTMTKVKKFCAEHDLIKDPNFQIGYGAGKSELLSFDPTFAEAAAAVLKQP